VQEASHKNSKGNQVAATRRIKNKEVSQVKEATLEEENQIVEEGLVAKGEGQAPSQENATTIISLAILHSSA